MQDNLVTLELLGFLEFIESLELLELLELLEYFCEQSSVFFETCFFSYYDQQCYNVVSRLHF